MRLMVPGVFILFCFCALARADETVDPKAAGSGRATYLTHCASCHGNAAKGDGPVAASLKNKVPDLTSLPLKDGKFDYDRIRTSVDGQQSVPSHGTRDMPVWGKVFASPKGEGYAQTEIWTLMQYIKSLQRAQPEHPAQPKQE
ncbi:MAG: cytochrome c [Acidobacteria bacterium]|nr:cytochrome c [Acidobacteriota bacterium]